MKFSWNTLWRTPLVDPTTTSDRRMTTNQSITWCSFTYFMDLFPIYRSYTLFMLLEDERAKRADGT